MSPPPQQVFNREPAASSCRRRQNNDDDMIAGKAPPPAEFNAKRERLAGLLLQLTDHFTITGIRKKHQKLACIDVCMEANALDWWQANEDKYRSCTEVQTGIES